MFSNINKESGVSLIITFFIMVIILAVVLSISTILYSQLKVLSNMSDSLSSFYAADSGIEKVLYYDNQVLPTGNPQAVRGLCTMYLPSTANPNACIPDPNPANKNPNVEHSMYCDSVSTPKTGPTDSAHGCDYNTCDDCTVAFDTSFDNRKYKVEAVVDGATSNFTIKSLGVYGQSSRQIQIVIGQNKGKSQNAITVTDACASPVSVSTGVDINISAQITAVNPIASAVVKIYNSSGILMTANSGLALNYDPDTSRWEATWNTNSAGIYYVNLEVTDNQNNFQKISNLQPYPLCIH